MIEAYVTNLGKYNEGELCGEYLKLPTRKEDVQSLLARIGADGVLYEEIFIADYKTEVDGLASRLGEYESVDELNWLASLLSEMNESELEKFEAAAACDDRDGSAKDLINLAQNLDCYEYYPGVSDNDELGRFLIDELGYENIPESLENYIDYDGYGRDFSVNEGGRFVNGGYVLRNGETFAERYDGRDIPEEYRIFAYPDPEKMSMRDRTAMYRGMVSAAPAADRPAPAREDRA
jgi:antirestriction protein